MQDPTSTSPDHHITPTKIVQPITLLTHEHGFVLGIRNSGFKTTPYQMLLLRRDEYGRLVDPGGKNVDKVLGHQIFAFTVPMFTADDVAAAHEWGKEIAEARAALPELEGDIDDHFQAALQIIHELSEAIGPRRAMLKLHQRLGDDIDGPRLPDDRPRDFYVIRIVLTKWVSGTLGDEQAIAELRAHTRWGGSL